MRFVVLKKNSLKLLVLSAVIMLMLSLNVFNNVSAAGLFFNNSVRKMPIYAVETAENKLALTFDAAWGADKTESILNVLAEHNVKATFFLVGFWAEEHSDIVKKIDEAGMEIGLHSNTHPDFTKLTKEQIKIELETNKATLEKITGKTHTLFRFPFGKFNDRALEVCEEIGLTPIHYSVDSEDWKGAKTTEMISKVLNKSKKGGILLFHINSDHIVETLPILLDRLAKKKFSVGTVSDILLKDNFVIDRQGIQRKK